MKKEKLIEELKKLPDGIEVRIFDHHKNLGKDAGLGDGSADGIYDFELNHFKEDEVPEGTKPWVGLTFNNEDYQDSKE